MPAVPIKEDKLKCANGNASKSIAWALGSEFWSGGLENRAVAVRFCLTMPS